MYSIPKSERTHIVFIGRTNSGKSSLVNLFFGQEVSSVSETPGATAGTVTRAMELPPYGNVVLVDTAGIDDIANLGEKRINRTIRSISSADLAVVVLDGRYGLSNEEVELFFYLEKISLPYLIVVNKIELGVNPDLLSELKNLKLLHFEISCKENVGIDELRRKVIRLLPGETVTPLIADLVSQGSIVVLVVPDDLEELKGRVILPQLQTIKEALDEDTIIVIVKDKELISALNYLNTPPDLVVTGSRTIMRTASDLPEKIKITTFSVLMARYKGDLPMFIRALKKIDTLKDRDKILIAEACGHHSQLYDTGRDQIEDWMKLHTEKNLVFDYVTGGSFPENLTDYKLIVHCSGCRLTRKMMHTRLTQAQLLDIPVVNYGLISSFMNGAIPRALIPFREAVAEWNNSQKD